MLPPHRCPYLALDGERICVSIDCKIVQIGFEIINLPNGIASILKKKKKASKDDR